VDRVSSSAVTARSSRILSSWRKRRRTARRSKDQGEKFHSYIAIEPLVAYLLVSQNEARAELFSHGERGHWDYTIAEGLESTIAVPTPGISLALADVYAEMDFAEAVEEE